MFPEHIHIEGEDRLLRRAASTDQYRHLMDEFLGVALLGGLVVIAAIVALALL